MKSRKVKKPTEKTNQPRGEKKKTRREIKVRLLFLGRGTNG